MRGPAQVRRPASFYSDMDTKVDISDEVLRRVIRQIDARPMPARLERKDRELLAQRLRGMPAADLRRRIVLT